MFNHPEFKDVRSFEDRLDALPAHVVYAQLMGRDSWGEAMQRLVPEHMRSGFVRYIAYGSSANNGHFLQALINNDLMATFTRADEVNQRSMKDWVTFLYNYAPSGCYGRPGAYDEWDGILREEETT